MQFGISFELRDHAMILDGVSEYTQKLLYGTYIPKVFSDCGFTKKLSKSLYMTGKEEKSFLAAMVFSETVKRELPLFCKYVIRCNIFVVNDISDFTSLIKKEEP